MLGRGVGVGVAWAWAGLSAETRPSPRPVNWECAAVRCGGVAAWRCLCRRKDGRREGSLWETGQERADRRGLT